MPEHLREPQRGQELRPERGRRADRGIRARRRNRVGVARERPQALGPSRSGEYRRRGQPFPRLSLTGKVWALNRIRSPRMLSGKARKHVRQAGLRR